MRGQSTPDTGRYAPSPTGDLHLGNVWAAACAFARARRQGGRFLLRIEDLDTPRVVEGAAAHIVEDLAALGFSFDAGPELDDGLGPYVQSECMARYHEALLRLRDAGRLYACACSRRQLRELVSAPHAGEEGPAYPGVCRHAELPLDDPALELAWRFRVEPGRVIVDDALAGTYAQDVAEAVGDFVVKRKDGLIAYHLAVVVDDAHQGVTEVVRGRDLLSSTPRQVQILEALGLPVPRYAHVPLLVHADGERLAKRRGDQTLRALLGRGVEPARILGHLGVAAGVTKLDEAITLEALATRLVDDVLRPDALVLPPAPWLERG